MKMEDKELVYIAGKINGDPNYKEKFRKAEEHLEQMGFDVVNPAELPEGYEKCWYMPKCLQLMALCDRIYFLPDWEESEGAKIEMAYAKYIEKPVHIIVSMG